jgi:hypothetical protein
MSDQCPARVPGLPLRPPRCVVLVLHGAFQQETITAKPGIYVEVCFMDTQDRRQHTQLGMERIIHIVK